MKPVRRTDFGKPLTFVEKVLMELVFRLGTPVYRLLCSTLRVRHAGFDGHAYFRRGGRGIGALWHQRLFCAPWALRRVPDLAFAVSQSKDGEMIRYVLEGLGYTAVQGSSSRRGSAAYLEMSRHLERGGVVGITPDGPRGPARKVQPGAPRLAVEHGLPLLPATIALRRCWIAPSWDRFLFPKPFGQVLFLWGDPIETVKGGGPEETERVTRLLEEALDRLTDEADRAVGLEPLPRGGERRSRRGKNAHAGPRRSRRGNPAR